MPTITLKIKDDELALIDQAAEHAGTSRSQFVRDAALAVARGVSDPAISLPVREVKEIHIVSVAPIEPKVQPATDIENHILTKAAQSPTVSRPHRETVDPKDCHHPPGRRLGKFCAACGKTVGK